MTTMDRQVEALCDEAALALDEDRPHDALEAAERAVALAPKAAEPAILRAESLASLDRWEEAERAYEQIVSRHPDDPSVLLAAAGFATDFLEDSPELVVRAIEMARRGERLSAKHGDEELEGACARVRARGHVLLGELVEAAEAYERARDLLGDEDDLLVELAGALFEVLRFDDARELLEEVLETSPNEPEAHHLLGLIAERAGEESKAEAHFQRAREIDPDAFPVPVRLSEDEFAQVVEEALEKLPAEVKEHLRDVPVMVEPLPRIEDLIGPPPLSPLSLGMFRGAAITERSFFDPGGQLPSSILLFQRNLERYAGSRDDLLEEIEVTVLHEVGHFVGWDEHDLFERGLH